MLALLGTGSVVAFVTGGYSSGRGHPFCFCGASTGPSLQILDLYRNMTGRGGLWISWFFPYDPLRYVHYFCWGIDFALGIVLATWFVARRGWWSTWGGRGRALMYSIAFIYGAMLTVTTQRWLHGLAPNGLPPGANGPAGLYADYKLKFHIPGTQFGPYYNDYSRPATDLLLLLASVLVLYPLFTVCKSRLGASSESSRLTIGRIIGWTTIFGLSLSFTRFLCWWVAPNTGFSNLEPSQAFAEFVLQLLPAAGIPCAAILMMATRLPARNWHAILFVIGLVWLDSLGSWLLSQLAESNFTVMCDNPMLGGARWAFQLGRMATVWIAFSIAAALGVAFQLPSERESNPQQ